MYKEELTETGIVKESKDGIAEIIIPNSAHCEECSAKVYCKPNSNYDRTITVKDSIGLKPGDFVFVSVSGSNILQTSFFLYGLPILILISGLIAGLKLFDYQKEFFSTVFSFILVTIYYFALKLRLKKITFPLESRIIIQRENKNL
jgi:sigma-E factor negative regulatory protein RseC